MPTTKDIAIAGAVILVGSIGGVTAYESLSGAVDTEPIDVVQPTEPKTGIKAGLVYGVIPADACDEKLLADLARSRPGSERTTTCETLRKSLDGKHAIVKWRGDPPKSVAAILVPEKTWTKDEKDTSIGWAHGAVDKALDHEAWTTAEVGPSSCLPGSDAQVTVEYAGAISGQCGWEDWLLERMPREVWGAPRRVLHEYSGVETSNCPVVESPVSPLMGWDGSYEVAGP
jgi:hypothetical protein